ncbi:hypothetical protein C0995_010232 [Termitomyces sp. Mi166|nr:hypothetical protein C0995_010232 [Termitomyces sp. Mi166\
MKCTAFIPIVALSSFPLVFGAEYLVGVGKDETTGKKGLGFDPSVIHPAVGDTIVWEFRSGQHSVVESTFDNPCVGKTNGINTGVQTVSDSLSVDAPGLPRYTVTVNSTDPQWFFDEAGGLCNQGAVLAVNPPTTGQTAAAFVENAKKSLASTPTSSSSSSPGNQNATDTVSSSATETASAAASATNAAGHLGQTGGLLLGALSFLLLGMF